jgi:hypothetical protein
METAYKCTYTLGVMCPVMGKFNEPNPSHCFAYDCKIWNINPKITCNHCVPLNEGEKPEKKIWCNDMDSCDAYNDGGSKSCTDCPAGNVVFGRELSNIQECLVKEVCPRGDGFCTEECHLCLNVMTINKDDIYVCIGAGREVVPVEVDLT